MNLIIVNYHYVDDEDKYQDGIYPVAPARLSRQLEALGEVFQFVSQTDLVAAVKGESRLPDNSCLITFDDGLKCQIDQAVPVLKKHNIPAIFFVNSAPLNLGAACLVHKIHFLLSRLPTAEFMDQVETLHRQLTGRELRLSQQDKISADQENKYDNQRKANLKYILNSYLEAKLAESIIDKIFINYYQDQGQFCREFYASQEDLAALAKDDLFDLGLHSAGHLHIPSSSQSSIAEDITANFRYLKNELSVRRIAGISYPYGIISQDDYRAKLKNCLDDLGLSYGLTVRRGLNRNLNQPFLLKRFDTNDVPQGKRPMFDFIKKAI